MTRFTQGELKVMQILWKHGELKPSEIQELYPGPIKNPALRSYLGILVDKGHLSRRLVGKAYYYRARTKQEFALKSMYRYFLDAFFHGSSKALLSHLIRSERFSNRELLELRKLAVKPAEPHRRKRF